MNILNLKSNKFLIILGLPIFISFSINENLIYFNRNVWDTFPPDSFSLPLGLICFFLVYLKELIIGLKVNLIFVIYLIIITLLEIISDSFTFRSLIEKVNLVFCIILIGIIVKIKLKDSELIFIRNYAFILSLMTISLWIFNADYNVGKGGKLFFNFSTYNFEQYGAFFIYCIYIISALYLKLHSFLFVTFIGIGELLYLISYSRIIYLPMIILFIIYLTKLFSNDRIEKYVLCVFKKIKLNFFGINIIYIIILIVSNGFEYMEFGRNQLVQMAMIEIFNSNIFFAGIENQVNNYLYSSHNQFLEIIRSSGVLGLLYFTWCIGNYFQNSNSSIQLIFTIYLYIIIGLFILPFTHPFGYSVLGLIILITGNLNRKIEN